MTSKSCFLQHKSPFENTELAGTGSSILSFQWLNFAWESLLFFFFPQMRITFQIQQSLLGGGNGNSKAISPQSHYPGFPSHWPSAKNLRLFREWWARTSWPALTAISHGDVTSSLGALAECDGGPTHVRATSGTNSEMVQGAWEEGDSIFLSQWSQTAPLGSTSETAVILPPTVSPIYTKHRETMRNTDVKWNK